MPAPAIGNTKLPFDFIVIAVAATPEVPSLKSNSVLLTEELKVAPALAWIPAAVRIASVPAASSGAIKSILPRVSPSAIVVSPVCNVRTIGLAAPVLLFLIARSHARQVNLN